MGILCPRAKLELRVLEDLGEGPESKHGEETRPGYVVIYVGEKQIEDEGFLDALAEFAHVREARLGYAAPGMPDVIVTKQGAEKGGAPASKETTPGNKDGKETPDTADPRNSTCEERLAEELERRGADCSLPEEPDAFVRSGMGADMAFGSNPFLLNEFFEWLDDSYGDGLGFGDDADDEEWADCPDLEETLRARYGARRQLREPAVGLWGCANVHLHL